MPDNSKVKAEFNGNTLTPLKTIFDKQYSLICTINDDDPVVIKNKIVNCPDKPMEFAPWSVTGSAPGGTEYIPLFNVQNAHKMSFK